MKIARLFLMLSASAIFTGCVSTKQEMPKPMSKEEMESFFMPNAQASKVVSVTTNGPALANILVQTHGVATKETGPKETVARFNEVYAFAPAFIAVHRDEPTIIRFWNLQPDDNHDFMLIDPNTMVLMKVMLPPLKETSFVFTFHKEGLFNFICAMHQPSMSGQILVLPPKTP
jgi:plastocyanin